MSRTPIRCCGSGIALEPSPFRTRLITWNSTAILTASSSASTGTPVLPTATASLASTASGSAASLSRNSIVAFASARMPASCGESTAAANSAPPTECATG
jgi:hypothetical protein